MHETLTERVKSEVGVVAMSTDTVQEGDAFDMLGFLELMVEVNAGTVTTSLAVKVQEGEASDGSDAVDVPGASVLLDAAGAAVGRVKWDRRKRYARIVATPTGTCVFAVNALKGMARVVPVDQTAAFDV